MAYELGFIGPNQNLGQSDSWVTSPDGTVMQNIETGAVIVFSDASSPSDYPIQVQPSRSGGDWWSNINWGTVKDIVGTVATGAASIIKAVTQQGPSGPVPAGFRYNPLTQRIEPVGTATIASAFPSWLLPIGVLGIGAVLLMRKR